VPRSDSIHLRVKALHEHVVVLLVPSDGEFLAMGTASSIGELDIQRREFRTVARGIAPRMICVPFFGLTVASAHAVYFFQIARQKIPRAAHLTNCRSR
jgi:hypothetical protein